MESRGPKSAAGILLGASIASAGFAAAIAGHLMPLSDRGPFVDAIQDVLHLPAFAVLALTLQTVLGALLPAWRPIVRAVAGFLVLAALGAALEELQRLTGREASFADYINDLTGAAAGIALWLALHRGDGGRRGAGALVGAVTVVACLAVFALRALPLVRQYQARAGRAGWLPVLFDPVIPLSRLFLFEEGARTSFSPPPEGWADRGDDAVLRVFFASAEYSAAGLHGLHPDWSGYDALCFPYLLEGDRPLPLKAIVEDDRSGGRDRRSGRAEFRLELSPGPGRGCVPFGGGRLYAGRILRVRLAAGNEAVVYFGEFSLERLAKEAPARSIRGGPQGPSLGGDGIESRGHARHDALPRELALDALPTRPPQRQP